MSAPQQVEYVMSTISNIINNHIQEYPTNYFEFLMIDDDVDAVSSAQDQGVQTLKTSIKKETFYSLMYKFMDTNYKQHQKQYTETVIEDVHYQNFKNEEMSVYSVVTNAVETVDNKVCVLMQNRNKLSILSVPSTLKIYSDNLVRKMTFKISNRVFVNFEHGVDKKERYYKVYVNYNHDKDVDVQNAITMIKNALSILMT